MRGMCTRNKKKNGKNIITEKEILGEIRQDNKKIIPFLLEVRERKHYTIVYVHRNCKRIKKKKFAKNAACTHTRARARVVVAPVCVYACVHGTACMYIGNTLVRLHLVARNSDADVIVTAKRNML